jgi:TPR repeat protein
MYRLGEGIPQDDELAQDWSTKAASTGNGQLYYESGILADYQKAANGDIGAMNSIGIKYRNGQDVTKNIPAAIKWYTRAANQGHVAAQINLGWVYKNEEQVKDLQKAVN